MQLIRLIKAFCPDFQPIRQTLTSIGAVQVEQMQQTDYFLHLPLRPGVPASRRLKLRVENQQPRCIYYYDHAQEASPIVTFQRFEIDDPAIQDLLVTILGIQTVVQKQREVWRTEEAIFNLDQVAGIGQIFEVELELASQDQPESQVHEYRELFGPYLREEIPGSNEDLVAKQLTKPSGDMIE
jgi:predicted adenylyl cyclase CyaB